ncbi:non-structural maintenance of chromosomes element 3 homolog [Diabrotica virgifera virgifera]|uniref:MAGE domain-containing protein n=1 Tax=Diabrotica virgifera virgifera TaxID=50390 RepID=A0ABM5IS63_DIAVI|nr:non-structural maintenance of chromosomes element 3 homolog [Diabrotica virgifera virgifera]
MGRPTNSSRSKGSQRSLSQLTQESSQRNGNGTDIEDHVNNLVRYFINRAGEHVSFKRTELRKNVLVNVGTQFQEIMNKATKILEEVYGYKILIADSSQNSAKEYLITNVLPYKPDPTEYIPPNGYPEDANKVFTLLVLSHVFMSNNSVSDNSLYSFLETFGIDVQRRHEIFGSIKDCLNVLKNKKYINMETEQLSKKVTFSWGSRAEKEISKLEVLKFVCKMYKTTTPTAWIKQYQSVQEQMQANEINNVDEDGLTQNTQS